MILLFVYGLAINAVAYVLFGFDKLKAKQGGRRVPEKRLFLVAGIGGAVGAWIAMRTFRHKTQHTSFNVGIPALIAVNVVCFTLLVKIFG
ncbi:MAG: hypothetical protein K0Q59_5171 [Paenibacillus sp.]|jgi:uncharacterized membrane protein YsdA (DUF1294 family)|nr:hypothetical protein [Paenibacillus sp.]